MNYSEKEMAALINEVETQFADHLKKTEDEVETKLAKSEESIEVKETKIETKVEAKVEVALEKTEAIELDYNEEDYVTMDEMYASMSKTEMGAHFESIKKSMGIEVESIQTDMKKSEEESNLMKSEIESKDGEIVDLKKSLSKLTVAMTDFLKGKAPKRKAVTHIEHVAKSEETLEKKEEKEDVSKLTQKEVSTRLTKAIRGGLEKAEREKINQFYEGELKFDSIKHLL